MAIQPSRNKMMGAAPSGNTVVLRGGCGAPVPVEDVAPEEVEKASAEEEQDEEEGGER